MQTEKEKMISGQLYNASDAALQADRLRCRQLLQQINELQDTDLRKLLLTELIPQQGKALQIEPPFYCDYGENIEVGNNVFFNFNCVVLDVMKVVIGDNVLIGPSVQIYTAMHPMSWQERASGHEFARRVTIGSDVWIAGGAIICPGVTIGNRSVIGAGSVVTKDIPNDVFAAGNPCKMIRMLNL